MSAPAFVSLDGLDGTGKSTQCRRLATHLRDRGYTVTECTDPGGTPLGAKLRALLLDARETGIGLRAEALLFMASRAELVEQVIRPALARGEVVVADRFLLANVVYQGHAGGLTPADVWAVGDFSTGGLRPDLAVVFDLAPEVAAARRGRAADRMEARGPEYFARVRAGFLAEAAADQGRIAVIDATPNMDGVFAKVVEVVSARLHL